MARECTFHSCWAEYFLDIPPLLHGKHAKWLAGARPCNGRLCLVEIGKRAFILCVLYVVVMH